MFSGVVTEAVLAEVAHRPHPAAVVAVAAEAAATVIDWHPRNSNLTKNHGRFFVPFILPPSNKRKKKTQNYIRLLFYV